MSEPNDNTEAPQGYPQQPQGQPSYPAQYPGYPGQHPAYPGQDPAAYPPHQPYGHYNPYAAQGGWIPPSGLPTAAFGGFWVRVVAYLIDALILAIPSWMISLAVLAVFGVPLSAAFDFQAQADPRYAFASNVGTLLQILLAWGYVAIFLVSKGATPGKMAFGLRVVDEHGMYCGFGRATGRYFAEILSCCLVAAGYIMIAFHEQKRGLHDLMCGTYVVRKEFVNPSQQQ